MKVINVILEVNVFKEHVVPQMDTVKLISFLDIKNVIFHCSQHIRVQIMEKYFNARMNLRLVKIFQI